MHRIAGLVLAAGAGRRAGGPKALRRTATGVPWTACAVAMLQGAGCAEVLVVLGAAADDARPLVPASASTVVATGWRAGMSASLRTGLDALPAADAVLIALVDLPGTPAAVATRLIAAGAGPGALARAVYRGVPGHPVLLGRDHLTAFRDALEGDRGGGAYLAHHGALRVECGDLFDGADLDGPAGS